MMFYIFNKKGQKIGDSSDQPNQQDLQIREEFAIESAEELGKHITANPLTKKIIIHPQKPSDYHILQGDKWVLTSSGKKQRLTDLITSSSEQIDNAVATVYQRFTRFEKEYETRESQARKFKENGYQGDVPSQVAAYAEPAGLDAKSATDDILTSADKLRAALDTLGKLRMQKCALRRMKTLSAINQHRESVLTKITAIGEQL